MTMGIEKNIKSKSKISEIKITKEFKEALRLMEKTKENLFITGKAGTGKSIGRSAKIRPDYTGCSPQHGQD
jgi:predicted ATPase with chaperone activity